MSVTWKAWLFTCQVFTQFPGQPVEFLGRLTSNLGNRLRNPISLIFGARLLFPDYFAIREAIASGRTRLNEIKQATGLSGVTAYPDTLQGLQLVERVVPVTESQPIVCATTLSDSGFASSIPTELCWSGVGPR